MILDTIVSKKRIRVEAAKKKLSADDMAREIENREESRMHAFAAALKGEGISLIAEVKKASPSKGLICRDFDPPHIAKEYEAGGAAAVSVLTEADFFLGSDEYLKEVRQRVKIPVLRKDFIFDGWQIYESAYLRADAVLLIAAILPAHDLKTLRLLADGFGMDALVEVHDADDLEKALESGADIIGINNRDLHTFGVDLRTTEKLMNHIPQGITTVSESGIFTRDDMVYLQSLGVDAALIGESLMRAPSISKKIAELKGGLP